jgi:hypothetical protein
MPRAKPFFNHQSKLLPRKFHRLNLSTAEVRHYDNVVVTFTIGSSRFRSA